MGFLYAVRAQGQKRPGCCVCVCTTTTVLYMFFRFRVSATPKKNLTVIAARYVESNKTMKNDFFSVLSLVDKIFLCGNFVAMDFLGKETHGRRSQPE